MKTLWTLSLLFIAAPVAQLEDPAPAVIWALRLPSLISEARDIGVADTALQVLLDELRREGLGADEAALVVREEVDALKTGGPKDNFGAFVQTQLAAGLRGRALAGAIRAEHANRGKEGRGRGRKPVKDTLGPHGGTP